MGELYILSGALIHTQLVRGAVRMVIVTVEILAEDQIVLE